MGKFWHSLANLYCKHYIRKHTKFFSAEKCALTAFRHMTFGLKGSEYSRVRSTDGQVALILIVHLSRTGKTCPTALAKGWSCHATRCMAAHSLLTKARRTGDT